MYLFSKENEKEISKISNIQIDSELRGYNLSPGFELLYGLSVSDVSNTYCETMRRIYLKKHGVDFGVNESMLLGGSIHSMIENIFQSQIENRSDNLKAITNQLHELKTDDRLVEIIWDGGRLQELHKISEDDYLNTLDKFKTTLREIIDLEIQRFRMINRFSKEIELFELEKYVDGNIFNLRKGKIDLITLYHKRIGICDLKTGSPFGDNKDAKLQIALYALMLENEHKVDVNWGGVIFPFEKSSGLKYLNKEPYKLIFSIDDRIRREALELLNRTHSILELEDPPPLCEKFCLSKEICTRGL